MVGPSALAAVDVNSTDLQSSSSIIFPNGNAIGALDSYENFELMSKGNLANGVYANYEAALASNSYITDELPSLQIYAYAYSSQEAAETSFNSYGSLSGGKILIDSDERNIFYKSAPGSNVDVFSSITTEDYSLHLIHLNGSILYQISLYRPSGEYNKENVEAFSRAIANTEQVRGMFENGLSHMKLALGILYPPVDADFSASSEKDSQDLSENFSFAKNGAMNFKLYVDDAESSKGTILDSSGLGAAVDGDIYLYLNKEGKLVTGIYGPDFDSSCSSSGGWHKIETGEALNFYEWNDIRLHYGVRGLWISINDIVSASCKISVAKSDRNLYFGDYPADSSFESFSGAIDGLKTSFDSTEDGRLWDDILSEQIFVDVPNTDKDIKVFEYLKERGIFVGSGGYLYPENTLSRAEMVKVLLKSFGHDSSDGTSPFWDVPADAWYLKYLIKASKIGMIEGQADGTFLPGQHVNRAEFVTMLYRISGEERLNYAEEFNDVSKDDWFAAGAEYGYQNNLVGAGYFYPSKFVTRRDAARSIYQIIK